jgi:hypothetical protein
MRGGVGVKQGDAGLQSNLPAFPVSNKILVVQPNRLENLDATPRLPRSRR